MLCPNCSKPAKPVLMIRTLKRIPLYMDEYIIKTVWMCPQCGLEIEETVENVVNNIMKPYVVS
jgi:C4-type Zn-finger protein